MRFIKYSSSGNDFLITTLKGKANRSTLAKAVCDRHNGIGADGMVVVLADSSTQDYAYEWEFYNADGSIAQMCGNASRSVGHYAFIEGIAATKHSFKSIAGIISVSIESSADSAANIAMVESNLGAYAILQDNIIESNPYGAKHFSLIDTGVPHLVGFVDCALPLKKDSLLESLRHKYNANISLGLVKNGEIAYITYERGVEDITLACGTGAAAVFVMAKDLKLCQSPCTLIPPSKKPLYLSLDSSNHILFKGEVTRIAECKWLLQV